MAGWLSRLVEGFWSLVPGTHEAVLEERRAGALLNKELHKPPGQRDEERVHRLRVDYRTRQLQNLQARAAELASNAASYEQPVSVECCAAAGWVRRRMAASYRALEAYVRQLTKQVKEELAAAYAWRTPVLVAEPALCLELPEELQQPPPRLDMCSACARLLQEAELAEQSTREHEQQQRSMNRQRGLQPVPAAAAASQEAAGGAAAAAAHPPAGEAQQQQGQQQGQQQQGLQQPQQPGQQLGQQQQQGQQPCGSDSLGAGAEGAPDTPTHLEMAPLQQQHSSSEGKEEQPQQVQVQVQERGAAEERQLLPLEAQQQHQRSSEGKEEQRQQVQLQE